MTRYQIYLNEDTVDVFEKIARSLDAPRSQLLRDVLDRVALRYEQVLLSKKALGMHKHAILEMVGRGPKLKSAIAEIADERYLGD